METRTQKKRPTGKPVIKMEDGEVVIERDGVETVMDPDDVTPSPVTRAADPDIEEVVIIGIQRALQGALEEKRQTTNLTDVINAEDIGKLPDENVAEVLENIPGVQITREGGIGTAVSIRGSDENRVEINGRGTLSDNDNRGGVRFSDLPAALVRSLTVTKVPTADMVEGSVGGTINVKTFRGLKLKKPLLVLNPRAEYADNADTWNQNYSGTAGNKFETPWGDLGVILTVSHFDKTVREDILRVSPSLRQVAGNTDFTRFPGQNQWPANKPRFQNCCDFDGNPDTFDPYYYPGYSETTYGFEDRENTTASGSLEWQAHDSLKLFAEGTYSSIQVEGRSPFAGASYGLYSNNPAASDRELDGIDRPNNGIVQSTFGFAEVADVQVPFMNSGCIGCGVRNRLRIDPIGLATQPDDGMQIRPGNRNVNRETDNFVAAIGGEWLDDEWLIEVEASASGSDSTTESFSNTWQYNDPADPSYPFHSLDARIRVPMLYDARDDELAYGPVPYGIFAGPGSPSPADNLLNPDYYSLYAARDTLTQFNNDLYAQRIDIERFLATPFFTSAAFGFRSSQRSTERQRNSVTTDTFPCQTTSTPASDNPCADPNVYAGLTGFLIPSPGDFFSFNPNAPYLRNFLTTGSDRIADLQAELVKTAGLAANPVLAPQQGFKVEEHTYAGYLRLDFETDRLFWPIKGNAGLRFVNTDQTAAGSQLQPNGEFIPEKVNQNYNNWLPSASLIVSPLEDLQVRFGYAKILRRPSFAQLAPTFEYPLNDGVAVTVGDPNLRPTTVQQFDAGIEWYFRKGSVLSAGYFYKNLSRPVGTEFTYGAICNPLRVGDRAENCGIPQPEGPDIEGRLVDKIEWQNLPGGQIQGVELAFQHKFNWLPHPLNGFGVLANYAYQDGERDLTFTVPGVLQNKYQVDAEFPLNFRRLSEHSYNVTLYYEKPKYGFSGRIRYTWRSNFLITESSDISYGRPLYRDDRGQLNASVSLRLPRPLDNFTVILWGINLTKTPSIERALFPDGPIARMKDADRRYAIGVRARF